MGHKLSLQKLAFSWVLSRDLGLWVCAACYIRGITENLAAYKCHMNRHLYLSMQMCYVQMTEVGPQHMVPPQRHLEVVFQLSTLKYCMSTFSCYFRFALEYVLLLVFFLPFLFPFSFPSGRMTVDSRG